MHVTEKERGEPQARPIVPPAAPSPPRQPLRTVRSLTPDSAATLVCRLLVLEHAADHQK